MANVALSQLPKEGIQTTKQDSTYTTEILTELYDID